MILTKEQLIEQAQTMGARYISFYSEKPKDIKTELTVFSIKEKEAAHAIQKLKKFLNEFEGIYWVLLRAANVYRDNAGSLVQVSTHNEAPKVVINGQVTEDYTQQDELIKQLKNRIAELESAESTRERILTMLWNTINPAKKDVTEILNGMIFGTQSINGNTNNLTDEQMNEIEKALQIILEKLGEETILKVADKLKNDHLGIVTKLIKNNLG